MKTVSLTEALKSGKKFRWRIPGQAQINYFDPKQLIENTIWSKDVIINAECIIEQGPREIWLWKFDDGALGSIHKKTEEELKRYYLHDEGKPVKFREVIDD